MEFARIIVGLMRQIRAGFDEQVVHVLNVLGLVAGTTNRRFTPSGKCLGVTVVPCAGFPRNFSQRAFRV
jgi:hypothetical protein